MANNEPAIFEDVDNPKLPKVSVYTKENPVKSNPGMASKIALIGAFDSTVEEPVLCTSIDDAYEKLGNDVTYAGIACLDELFYGASSILAVNITTGTGENRETSMTPGKLTTALSKISGESFDKVYLAVKVDNNLMPILDAFLKKRFKDKIPAGFVAYYDGTPNLAGDFCYGIMHQQLIVNDTLLSEIESGAYYCAVLASLNVGNSMTMKVVPNVTGVTPELSFERGGNGLSALDNGLTVFRCQDRANNKYIVVNSEQPNGYDLYINRVRDFVVREMSLHQYLGDRNRSASLNEIKQELDRVKERCVNTLDLLKDIEYTVEKKSPKCVDVNITRLLFDGIITEINVYITIEVE